ncbi:hypothetical protein BD413DRAFT_641857 [Trametes elegans]|nr:hypothetical protein BD413DRAFT_641857 [Trametes elegans]
MFPFFTPVLTTPLLKIPLLLTDAFFTYVAMTPPTPPPTSKEKQNFAAPVDYFRRTFALQTTLVQFSKWAIVGMMLAECATILAQRFPSRLSSTLLSVLLPATGPGAQARVLDLAPTPRFLFCCLAGLTGGALRAWCYRSLGRFFNWQLSVQDDHRLVTSGPYALVRHPSYLGGNLGVYGNLAMIASPGSYFSAAGLWYTGWSRAVACFVVAHLSVIQMYICTTRVKQEDEVLRKQFGEEWEAWARQTPYKLIPFLY